MGRASNCSILYLLIPVLSAIMASVMLGKRLTPLRVLALGIDVLGLSIALFFFVLKWLPVTVALASTSMTPVFGVVLAMLLLPERLTATTIGGATLVLAAPVLVMRYDAGGFG